MKWTSFNGLDTRSEFWTCQLLLGGSALIVGFTLATLDVEQQVWSVFYLLALILGLMSMARRFRDMGVNPWWVLASFIPFIGFILLIIAGFKPTKCPEKNPYYKDSETDHTNSKPELTKTSWNE